MGERSIVRTGDAPAAIGPYSQAVVVTVGAQKMVFCSGQIALDPKTNTMVASDVSMVDGEVVAQTRQVLANLGAVLEAAGASFADVVKTTIYLADMADFVTVNKIYGERFVGEPPARATVQAAGLPRNARVEIDAIAVIG